MIRLTEMARNAGCSCKINPAALKQILGNLTINFSDPMLLIGNKNADDASVLKISETQALISTVDFFTPIVDDAYKFGFIAAANALSDVYAMGGKPIIANAVLGWPLEKLPAETAQQVMQGAHDVCAEANISLAGGHSIDSIEPFFGLSVNGIVDIKNIKSNDLAQAGDILYITKPLGLGFLSAGHKRGKNTPEQDEAMIATMQEVNSFGYIAAQIEGVHAITDITGFGLAGHLNEICTASNLSAHLNYSAIPILPEALINQAAGIIPDATYRNWNAYSSDIKINADVNMLQAFSVLPDPQTNGGLLISVSKDAAPLLEEAFLKHTGKILAKIGSMQTQSEYKILVSA